MPLVRVEVRNEYGLGMPELYTETNREDPRAILDGVTVAGLVGILRQVGDLSEFAAEVFHGIEEQVLITSSRTHKVGERLYNIEAALPLLEKAILAQRSHLHFTYASGSQWHTRPRTEHNHFIHSDLPWCIMNSYEDCHDPPPLHNLDKFDISGRGSCFERYSDPTYFRRASAGPCVTHLQSVQREKKTSRSKKKRSLSRHRHMKHDAALLTHDSGMAFDYRNSNVKTLPPLDASAIHVVSKSGIVPEIEDHLISFDSSNGSGYIECILRTSYSTQSEENEAKELSSDSEVQQNACLDLAPLHENSGVSDENVENSNLQESSELRSSFINWDEKLEITESTGLVIDTTEILKSNLLENSDQETYLQITGTSLISFTSADDFKSGKGEIVGTSLGAVAKNGLFSSSREPNSQSPSSEQILTIYESPKHPLSTSGAQNTLTNTVMFWTNGGLLGLAPSKPPDFGLASVDGQDSVAESDNDLIRHSSQKHANEDDRHVVRADMVGDGSKSEANHAQAVDCNASSTTTPAIDGPVTKDGPTKSIKENGISSSRIFEFSNKLLVNGFQRQISLVGDDNLPSSMKSDVPKKTSIHTGHHTVKGRPFGEQFGNGSPRKSPSSPPLQHMKICFQPIDGFETSKLKLKFPDESNCDESSVDMFPSFQLVQPAVSLHGLDSDSDDNTFCRSSLYASDDCCSHHSESNSEQWGSGDSQNQGW